MLGDRFYNQSQVMWNLGKALWDTSYSSVFSAIGSQPVKNVLRHIVYGMYLGGNKSLGY